MIPDHSDNQQLTELNWSGGAETPGYTNVRASGQLIANYDLSGSQPALSFHFGDWLGTLRVTTDAAGNVSPSGGTCISLPYGDGEYCTPTQSTNYLFNAKERDPETGGPNGNDYFGARYYASTMGQFLTPDWSVKAEPVPYAKVDNPQSLNLYRYVFDNPLTGVDLDGHQSDQVPAADADSFAGDYCATQVGSNNLGNCIAASPGKAKWEEFADGQKDINQKLSAQQQTVNASLTWKGVGETAVGVILTGAAVAAAPESGGSSLAAIPIVFGVVGGEGVVGKGMLDTANGLNLTDNKSAAEGKEGMDLATNPASAAVLPFTGPKTAGAVGTVVSTAMGLRDLSQPPTGVADAINKAGSARDVFSSARQFVHQVVTNIQSWLSPVPVN